MTRRIALITGAARGIGAAVAERLARDGMRVVVTDIRDSAGEDAADGIGEGAEYQRLDVREESDWEAVTASVLDRYGRLDVLVNNAGITGFEDGAARHDPEHAGEGPEREARLKAFVRDIPLRRFGTPEEVAALVAYLASDESAYTTGAEFVVDGGILAGAAASPED